jgi:hypothetical protein
VKVLSGLVVFIFLLILGGAGLVMGQRVYDGIEGH